MEKRTGATYSYLFENPNLHIRVSYKPKVPQINEMKHKTETSTENILKYTILT